jgi:hypothetical protein
MYDMSVCDYVYRVLTIDGNDFEHWFELLVHTTVVLERYAKGSTISVLELHRLFLVAFVLSNKVLLDDSHRLIMYARLGGVSVTELAVMEIAFLERVDWDVCVGRVSFEAMCDRITGDVVLGCTPPRLVRSPHHTLASGTSVGSTFTTPKAACSKLDDGRVSSLRCFYKDSPPPRTRKRKR